MWNFYDMFQVVWASGVVSVLVLKIFYAAVGMLYFPHLYKISRSFADHPSKILIIKVNKFYTGFTKNRRVYTPSQHFIHLAIRCYAEKYLITQIQYRRFQKKKYTKYMLPGILLYIYKFQMTYFPKSSLWWLYGDL